jgi:hypothetical protein
MAEPITAIYVQENDDWTVTVAGQDKTLTGRAPGIIAARDSVDQLVEQLVGAKGATVVHLLNGSALDFTAAYMTARLSRPETAPIEAPEKPAADEAAAVPAQQSVDQPAEKPKNKASRRPKAKLTADIGDALEAPQQTKNLPAKTGTVTVAKATVPSARA